METTEKKYLHSWDDEMQTPNPKNRIAPKGKFRLLGIDLFEGPFAEFPAGIFDTPEAALASGKKQKGTSELLKFYVYDDKGDFIDEVK